MISSGALPNVTFSRPPTPGPARCESSSVARPISAAVGTTPSADEKNTMIGSAPAKSSTIATAMNGTSRYGQPEPLNRNRLKLVALASLTDAGAYPRPHGRKHRRRARRARGSRSGFTRERRVSQLLVVKLDARALA